MNAFLRYLIGLYCAEYDCTAQAAAELLVEDLRGDLVTSSSETCTLKHMLSALIEMVMDSENLTAHEAVRWIIHDLYAARAAMRKEEHSN